MSGPKPTARQIRLAPANDGGDVQPVDPMGDDAWQDAPIEYTQTTDNKEHDPRADLDNARALVDWFGPNLRYISKWKKWATWDETAWKVDTTYARKVAHQTADRLFKNALSRTKAFKEKIKSLGGLAVAMNSDEGEALKAEEKDIRRALTHAQNAKNTKQLNAMLTESAPLCAIEQSELDAFPWLLNVSNGTLDLKTGELRNHRREDLLTVTVPIDYDANAKCPIWEAFLRSSLKGDLDLIKYHQRISGYVLTGDVSEQVLFFFYGEGQNGKSVFGRIIARLLGAHSGPAPRDLLMVIQGNKHPTELALLHGKRLALCGEVQKNKALDESKAKDLTGGDRIAARRMAEDFWDFTPTHKLFLWGQHRPTVSGTDEGIWRRIKLITWPVKIPESQKDPHLFEKLLEELPGILAWAVRGCLEWQRIGLAEPEVVTKATSGYREDSDELGDFFATRCDFAPNAQSTRKALWGAYQAHCEENGTEPSGILRSKEFTARVKARAGVEEGKPYDQRTQRTVRGWKGLGIKPKED